MSITERKLKNGKTVYDNAFMYKGIRCKKRGFTTKGAANEWEIELKHDINNGSYTAPCNKTFIQVFEEYYKLSEDDYKFNTVNTYKTAINHIKKNKISKMKIVNMTYKIIQSYFNEIAKILNKDSCSNIKKIFNVTFRYAMQNNYIKSNPMRYVENKGKKTRDKTKKETISYDEFNLICSQFISNNDFNCNAIYIALNIGYYTGARISEILGLNKSDINFEDQLITFNKKLECREKKENLHTSEMKTETSYDVLPLAEPLAEILLQWFGLNPYEKIICLENGEYMRYGYIYNKVHTIVEDLGIKFNFHMLRHTYASNIVNSGVNISIAKSLLRHAKVETTLNIYAHSNIYDEKKALEQVFSANQTQDYPKITPKVN